MESYIKWVGVSDASTAHETTGHNPIQGSRLLQHSTNKTLQHLLTILISTILYTYFYHLKKIWWHLLHFTIGDWVSHLLFSDNKERPQRPVTFDKFDHIDEETWPDQHFEFFLQFLTIFFNVGNFDIFCLNLFDNFDNYWIFLTIVDNCWQFF